MEEDGGKKLRYNKMLILICVLNMNEVRIYVENESILIYNLTVVYATPRCFV